jgi:hypothetical protein
MPPLDEISPRCPLNPRYPEAFERCRSGGPNLLPAADAGGTSYAACWLYDSATARKVAGRWAGLLLDLKMLIDQSGRRRASRTFLGSPEFTGPCSVPRAGEPSVA